MWHSTASRNNEPTVLPIGASCTYASRFIAQSRSRSVPGHTNVVPARAAMQAPTARKVPTVLIAHFGSGRIGAGGGMTVLCSGQRKDMVNRKAQQESGDH